MGISAQGYRLRLGVFFVLCLVAVCVLGPAGPAIQSARAQPPEGEAADQAKDKDKKDDSTPSFISPNGGARTKGAIFLVNRKTRNVVWSAYIRPKNTQPDELNHTADKIATQLEKDKRGKKEK